MQSLAQLQELLDSDAYDFHYDLGINISSNTVCLADRKSIVSSMSFHYGVLVVKAELDQILCGLSETLHALQLIREYAVVMRPLCAPGSTATNSR